MSTLYLIRHAQASMFAANYDQLSPLGEQQARTLGEALAERLLAAGRPGFDVVYRGPARRHRDTAALACAALHERGLSVPEPIELPEADEHDGQRLVMAVLGQAGDDPELKPLAERAMDATLDRRARSRAWQLVFEAIMRRWLRGELAVADVESWPDFSARVRAGFAKIRAEARGEVLLFTSVGPKAVILHELLGVPELRAFELGWRLYNTSITRVLYGQGRATLDGFNEVAHLPLSMWTHR